MADIALANSTYSTGTNDTASTLVNNVTATDAQQYNGVGTAIVGIETILGTGTDLKGSAADLVARLAVEHNADGTQKTLTVAKGGTGVTTLADGAVLLGNAAGVVQALALPSLTKVLVHSGTAAADPVWGSGLMYQGPSSCGVNSTRTHEGSVTVSVDGNYSGIHYYTDFTLNAGVTMTVPAGKRRLVILATGTVTINGTITATGAGAATQSTTETKGNPGTAASGGGGDGVNGGSGSGGDQIIHTIIATAGGGEGQNGIAPAVAGSQATGSDAWLGLDPLSCIGGASGGCGAGGTGGAGGGSIIIIAPVVVLAATATLNTTGSAGTGAAGAAGGGGGAGNVYILTRSYTDSGAAFTLTGGAGAGVGAAGGNGLRQVLIYA